MRKYLLLGLAIGAALFSGCANHSAAPQKVVTYAIIPKMLNNPVFTLAQRGAEKAAKDLEAQHPDTKYNIIYESSQTGVASEEAETVDTLASKKVDGMAISVVDPNALTKPINDAVAAGIPVICFDSDAPGSNEMSFFSVDNIALGNTLANQCLYAVDPDGDNVATMGPGRKRITGEFAIMSGQSSAANLNDRLKGVQQVLSRFPGVTVLPTLYCDDNTDKAVEEIRTTMQAHPKLRGLILVGGWPLFAKGALDEINPNVTKVVSADGLDQERDYMRQGKVQCLVAQRCFDWGSSSVHILENIRTGVYKKAPKFVNSGFDVILVQPDAAEMKLSFRGMEYRSLSDYDEMWKQWNNGQDG